MGRSSPPVTVSIVASSIVLTKPASGCVPIDQLMTMPSKQSIWGEIDLAGWDLELGNVCEPFFVRRLRVEVAINQVLRRRTYFAQVEPKRRRFGLATTRLSCFINRCTTFSEIVTLCLASDA